MPVHQTSDSSHISNSVVYYYGFDALRLLLSVVILFLHFNWKNMPQGYLSADMFFILSGFLLSASEKESGSSPRLIGIFKKLYPQYLISIILFIIVQYGYTNYPIFDITFALGMFQTMGFNDALLNTPTWFICVFVWISTMLLFLKRAVNKDALFVILPLLSFISYIVLHANTPSMGINYSYDLRCFGVPVSIWRGLGGISLGMTLGLCRGLFVNITKVRATAIELLLAIYMIYILKYSPVGSSYDFIFLALCSAFIYMTQLNKGLVSNSLYYFGKKCSWAYKASIGIFIYQMPIITLLRQHLSTDGLFGAKSLPWVLAIALLSCTIYYLSEFLINKAKKVI